MCCVDNCSWAWGLLCSVVGIDPLSLEKMDFPFPATIGCKQQCDKGGTLSPLPLLYVGILSALNIVQVLYNWHHLCGFSCVSALPCVEDAIPWSQPLSLAENLSVSSPT